jgi:hypothetical protein
MNKCSMLGEASLGLIGLPLSVEVGIFTLLGTAFLGSAAIGLAGLLGFGNRPRPSWFHWLLLACAPLGLACYSQAMVGDWRSSFGL